MGQKEVGSLTVETVCRHTGCQPATVFGRAFRHSIGPDGQYDEARVRRDFGKFEAHGDTPDYVNNYLKVAQLPEQASRSKQGQLAPAD